MWRKEQSFAKVHNSAQSDILSEELFASIVKVMKTTNCMYGYRNVFRRFTESKLLRTQMQLLKFSLM
jgi:hypothetical protein